MQVGLANVTQPTFIEAADLEVGDRFLRAHSEGPVLTLLRRETYTHSLLGPEWKLWVRREDTGETGWIPMGFKGMVQAA